MTLQHEAEDFINGKLINPNYEAEVARDNRLGRIPSLGTSKGQEYATNALKPNQTRTNLYPQALNYYSRCYNDDKSKIGVYLDLRSSYPSLALTLNIFPNRCFVNAEDDTISSLSITPISYTDDFHRIYSELYWTRNYKDAPNRTTNDRPKYYKAPWGDIEFDQIKAIFNTGIGKQTPSYRRKVSPSNYWSCYTVLKAINRAALEDAISRTQIEFSVEAIYIKTDGVFFRPEAFDMAKWEVIRAYMESAYKSFIGSLYPNTALNLDKYIKLKYECIYDKIVTDKHHLIAATIAPQWASMNVRDGVRHTTKQMADKSVNANLMLKRCGVVFKSDTDREVNRIEKFQMETMKEVFTSIRDEYDFVGFILAASLACDDDFSIRTTAKRPEDFKCFDFMKNIENLEEILDHYVITSYRTQKFVANEQWEDQRSKQATQRIASWLKSKAQIVDNRRDNINTDEQFIELIQSIQAEHKYETLLLVTQNETASHRVKYILNKQRVEFTTFKKRKDGIFSIITKQALGKDMAHKKGVKFPVIIPIVFRVKGKMSILKISEHIQAKQAVTIYYKASSDNPEPPNTNNDTVYRSTYPRTNLDDYNGLPVYTQPNSDGLIPINSWFITDEPINTMASNIDDSPLTTQNNNAFIFGNPIFTQTDTGVIGKSESCFESTPPILFHSFRYQKEDSHKYTTQKVPLVVIQKIGVLREMKTINGQESGMISVYDKKIAKKRCSQLSGCKTIANMLLLCDRWFEQDLTPSKPKTQMPVEYLNCYKWSDNKFRPKPESSISVRTKKRSDLITNTYPIQSNLTIDFTATRAKSKPLPPKFSECYRWLDGTYHFDQSGDNLGLKTIVETEKIV